jgi:uncharacterized protein
MNYKIKNVALTLLGINVLIFLLQIILGDTFTITFLLDSSNILTQPWTLITSMFLHSGPTHLLFNMYALFLFGTLVEQRIGSKRFLYVYFISGILASIGFALFHNFIVGMPASAVGASGAIMGILGVTIMLFPDLKVLFFFFIPMTLRTAGIIFALIDVFGLFYNSGIANSAHLAGLASGLLFGWHLISKKKQFQQKFQSKKKVAHSKQNKDIMMSTEELQEYMKNGRL